MHSEHILTISETSRNRCTLPAPFLLAQHLPRRPSQPHLTAQSNYHFFTIPHHSPHGPLHLYLICIRCLVNASRPRLACSPRRFEQNLWLASPCFTLAHTPDHRRLSVLRPHHHTWTKTSSQQPCFITYPSAMLPRIKKKDSSSPIHQLSHHALKKEGTPHHNSLPSSPIHQPCHHALKKRTPHHNSPNSSPIHHLSPSLPLNPYPLSCVTTPTPLFIVGEKWNPTNMSRRHTHNEAHEAIAAAGKGSDGGEKEAAKESKN